MAKRRNCRKIRIANARIRDGGALHWNWSGWAETGAAEFMIDCKLLNRREVAKSAGGFGIFGDAPDAFMRSGDWDVEIIENDPTPRKYPRPDDWTLDDENTNCLLMFSAFTHDRGHEPYASEHRRIEAFHKAVAGLAAGGGEFEIRRVKGTKEKPWKTRMEVRPVAPAEPMIF